MLTSDHIVGFAVSLSVTFLFYALALLAKRPKLIVWGRGGGSGGPNNLEYKSVGMLNDPGFLGLRVKCETANIVSARLTDAKSKKQVALRNNWQIPGSSDMSDRVSIEAGQQASLYLLVRVHDERVYYPCVGNGNEIDRSLRSYSDERNEFTLTIKDSIGRTYQTSFIVHNGHQFEIRHVLNLARRKQYLREGFSLIASGLKLSKHS